MSPREKFAGREELQWGRDRSVAECVGDVGRTSRCWQLQWGRDRSVAEWLGCDSTLESRKLRPQWGRDRSVAEGQAQQIEKFVNNTASMGPRPISHGVY